MSLIKTTSRLSERYENVKQVHDQTVRPPGAAPTTRWLWVIFLNTEAASDTITVVYSVNVTSNNRIPAERAPGQETVWLKAVRLSLISDVHQVNFHNVQGIITTQNLRVQQQQKWEKPTRTDKWYKQEHPTTVRLQRGRSQRFEGMQTSCGRPSETVNKWSPPSKQNTSQETPQKDQLQQNKRSALIGSKL